MNIRIDVVVANPAAALADGFTHIQIHRSRNGRNGVYTEITKVVDAEQETDDRPIIEAGKSVYTWHDEEGCADDWYKARYFNATTSAVSVFTDPFQGDADSALDILSVEDFKTFFLWGVDLSKDDGDELPDSFHEFYIKSAVSWLEQKLDVILRPKTIVERHDYIRNEYDANMFFKLNHKPVSEVQKVSLKIPGSNTSFDYNLDDVLLEPMSGQVNIIQSTPGAGGGVYVPWRPFSPSRGNHIPHAFEFTYRAGFERGKVPDNIRELVGKIASFGPLNVAGDLVGGAGVAATSLSIDGLSQSVTTTNSSTNAGFGARLIQYRKEINDQLKEVVRNYFSGPRFTVA